MKVSDNMVNAKAKSCDEYMKRKCEELIRILKKVSNNKIKSKTKMFKKAACICYRSNRKKLLCITSGGKMEVFSQ